MITLYNYIKIVITCMLGNTITLLDFKRKEILQINLPGLVCAFNCTQYKYFNRSTQIF